MDAVGRHRVGTVGLVVIALAAACGDDDDLADSAETADDAGAVFCAAWNDAVGRGDDDAFDQVLANPPNEIADDARTVRESGAAAETSPEAEAAARRIWDWTELNCPRGDTGTSIRRIAPPPEADLDGLTFCETLPDPFPAGDRTVNMVLYGDSAAADPYAGPMLGLLWNPVDQGDHGGDGDGEPVTVRGVSGVVAPITVFQQTVLAELGTVVAWREGDLEFGLYGREWSMEQSAQLVAIAEGIERTGGDDTGFRIAADALPDGYAEVFTGDSTLTSLVFPSPSIYTLRFDHSDGSDGILSVYGLHMTEPEFDAFRFFAFDLERQPIGGREAVVGTAWGENGPAVVTWREDDGLVVRIVGLGTPLGTARQVAEASRELTDDDWAALVQADPGCE